MSTNLEARVQILERKVNNLTCDKGCEVKEEKTLEEKFQDIIERERGMYTSAKEWEKAITACLSSCATQHFREMFINNYQSQLDNINEQKSV